MDFMGPQTPQMSLSPTSPQVFDIGQFLNGMFMNTAKPGVSQPPAAAAYQKPAVDTSGKPDALDDMINKGVSTVEDTLGGALKAGGTDLMNAIAGLFV